jgi:hypothetical protein
MKKIIGLLSVILLINIILIPNAVATGDEGEVVKITRPENGYIYFLDQKTIPYGYPFFNQAFINSGPKTAYTYGPSIITIEVEVNSDVIVDHVTFKVMERTLRGRVFIKEYEDFDAPYQFKFSRTRVFPYRNYDVYVDAIDEQSNILGSDSIGIGFYRSFYAKANLFVYFLSIIQ